MMYVEAHEGERNIGGIEMVDGNEWSARHHKKT